MKISITRLLELSKALATDAGKQLEDTLTYLAELAEQTVRSLRNGLTFSDNFAAKVATVSLKHDVAQTIAADRPVVGIIPIRAFSTAGIDSFAWYYDSQSRVTVRAKFVGAPTTATDCTLVILY